MVEMNAENIKDLQSEWKTLVARARNKSPQSPEAFLHIKRSLAAMGLDLSQHASYEILEEGLTRFRFEKTYTHLLMNNVLRDYHKAHGTPAQFNARNSAELHYLNLKTLLKNSLPTFIAQVDKTGLPLETDTMSLQQLALIRHFHKDGLLDMAMKQAANDYAVEELREAHRHMKVANSDYDNGTRCYACQLGRVAAEHALKLIDDAGAYHKPAEIEMSGLNEVVKFSRENIIEIRDSLLQKEEAIIRLEQAPKPAPKR